MTRAEAAKICQSIKFMMDKDDYSEEVEEALDMAMEALEQEETLQNLTRPNKSDLISRQAAIDAVFGRSHDIIKQRLKILPTAQPFTEEQIQTMQELEFAQIEKAYELGKADRPKWIPCSERLAEFPCIIQDANGNKPSIPSGIVTVESEDHGTWQIDGSFLTDIQLNSCFNWHNRIIAWMPLPEAYREDGEEE